MPHRALFFHAFHFQIRHRRAQHGIPVHQPLATVNQTLLKQAHEHFGNGLRARLVHREILALPIGRAADAAHLLRNRAAGDVFPCPYFFQKRLAPQIVARHALGGKLPLHHNLRGDACVVGTRNPSGVAAFHAVIAREAVHNRLIERVPHVQRAGYVGRRKLDGKRGFRQIHIGGEIAFGFPVLIVFGFDVGGGVFVEHDFQAAYVKIKNAGL